MTRYSLKAACSHCQAYGTVDDQTLECCKCRKTHEITNDERTARDHEIAYVGELRPSNSRRKPIPLPEEPAPIQREQL
jgi:hypothetical protein